MRSMRLPSERRQNAYKCMRYRVSMSSGKTRWYISWLYSYSVWGELEEHPLGSVCCCAKVPVLCYELLCKVYALNPKLPTFRCIRFIQAVPSFNENMIILKRIPPNRVTKFSFHSLNESRYVSLLSERCWR
jgi:hypothetical protein